MGVVIEREEWALTPLAYPLLSAASLAAVLLLPCFSPPSHSTGGAAASSSHPPSPFDVGTTPFLRFRRAFLFVFSLASVAEGIHSVFGEDEFTRCGLGREQMASRLAAAAAAALFLGGLSGVVSDKLGPRRACIFYWTLQLAVGTLKSFSGLRCACINNLISALASSMFYFCFETWFVAEHEKQGQKQDLLFDSFWLMTFFESMSLVGSQGITNLLVHDDDKGFLLPYAFAALLSVVSILYIRKNASSTTHHASVIGSYQKSFFAHVFRDKRVLILVLAQASILFSMSAFWFLWAPTIVADGRDAQLSLISPCFLASRMFGSISFPWFYGATAPFRNEDSLTTAFITAGIALSIVAYDYQEIGTLVILFCIFHACVGFILPSLARLRTMYLPNELRGGMMSFSLGLANAALFIFLMQGAYHQNIANSTILGFAACGLLVSGGCIHMLRRRRKHPRQDTRSL
ncbi:molybdate-anion transporter [Oryza brachyantha]|uniref:molybdate-anion transporter n=1 Tax=Oryza brachyantha TaxID=4533 RepID=UPI001ADBA5AC|nr:molybdate-anion transporter [Oryza brachyantha]XP_015696208.2 molybdate-anion transporter [Oryza brachyantha]XP_015696209.2 molybdate-anion transporter [Oryza brachyantha]